MKLSEIAKLLNCTLKGEDKEITGVNTLKEATSNDLSFLANLKYTHQLDNTKAGAVILKEEFSHKVETALISEKPYEDFARCIGMFEKKQGFFQGVSPQAYIHPTAKIGENCIIYPFVTVGENAVIGDNCKLFSNVYIGEDTTLGNNCILYPNVVIMANITIGNSCCLQPGAVIGAEGFGYVPTPIGIQKIPQIGTVQLADKVEIGANSCIDRGALAATKIGERTAIDNLVQIGHNNEVGKDCLIVAQVGIAGSTTVGDNVTIAAQAGIVGHLHIHSNAVIGPQCAVVKDIPANSIVGGVPATDQKNFLRVLSLTPRLPELFQRLKRVEKTLDLNEKD